MCKPRLRYNLGDGPLLPPEWGPESRQFALDLVGLGLWWGEGRKGRGEVFITNTDPDVILIFLNWLREIYRVPLGKFRIGLHLYDDLDIKETVRFWHNATGIPYSQFHRPYVFPRKNSKRRNRIQYGICTLGFGDIRLADKLYSRMLRIRQLASPALRVF